MGDVSDPAVELQGLNASERALAWAFARHGGDPRMVGGLEPDAAADLDSVVVALAGLDTFARDELARGWSKDSRRAERRGLDEGLDAAGALRLERRWEQLRLRGCAGSLCTPDSYLTRLVAWMLVEQACRAAYTGGARCVATLAPLAALKARGEAEARRWFTDFGLYEFVEVLRRQDRRRLARALRDMPRPLREAAHRWLRAPRFEERPMGEEEFTVVREAYLGVSRAYAEVDEQLWHLGMYLVALAAGDRYIDSLRAAAAHLPRSHRRPLAHYQELCARSTRRSLTRAVRASLAAFVEAESLQATKEGGNDAGR